MINHNIAKSSLSAPISVILPVYNCPSYTGEAIESILGQTFKHFELIIIDDGSTDNTSEIVKSFSDPRIRFFQQENKGLASTLNRGIQLAHGKYIARQDQDDISKPSRLEKQFEFLESHAECAMVGSWAEIWVENEKTERIHRHPCDNETLKFELLFNNPFVHSSIMLRKSVLDLVGMYSTDRFRQPPEDYELWSRIAQKYEVANIPEILLIYRELPQSMSRNGISPFLKKLIILSSENIAWASTVSTNDSTPHNIAALFHKAYDLIEGKPDFRSMTSLLQCAVAHISPNNTTLQLKAKFLVQQLKIVYLSKQKSSVFLNLFIFLLKIKIKFLRMKKITRN